MACDECRALLDELARLRRSKELVEEMAQERGWAGYSQGGDPAGYLFDSAVEAEAHTTALRGVLEHIEQIAEAPDLGSDEAPKDNRELARKVCYLVDHIKRQAQAALRQGEREK